MGREGRKEWEGGGLSGHVGVASLSSPLPIFLRFLGFGGKLRAGEWERERERQSRRRAGCVCLDLQTGSMWVSLKRKIKGGEKAGWEETSGVVYDPLNWEGRKEADRTPFGFKFLPKRSQAELRRGARTAGATERAFPLGRCWEALAVPHSLTPLEMKLYARD